MKESLVRISMEREPLTPENFESQNIITTALVQTAFKRLSELGLSDDDAKISISNKLKEGGEELVKMGKPPLMASRNALSGMSSKSFADKGRL